MEKKVNAAEPAEALLRSAVVSFTTHVTQIVSLV